MIPGSHDIISPQVVEMAENSSLVPLTNRGTKWPCHSEAEAAKAVDSQATSEDILTQTGCCTQKAVSFSAKTSAIVGVDWITLEISSVRSIDSISGNFLFEIDPQFFTVQYWKKCYKVLTIIDGRSETFGTLMTDNVQESYHNAHFKVENRFLYSPDLQDRLQLCFQELGFKFLSIVRIDPFIDFQRLAAGIKPEHFIKGNFNGDYLKAGRASRIGYAHSNDHTPTDFTVHSLESDRMKITGAIWGKRKSGFQIRMYNKSEEMRKQLHKPYIAAMWEQAGFDAKLDTWRLEPEIHTKDFAKVDKVTGDMIECMRTLDTITPENILKLASMMVYRHFKFHRRKVTINGKRTVYDDRKRRLPFFHPLEIEKFEIIKVKLPSEVTHGMSQKIQIKKLVKCYQEFKDEPTKLPESLKKVIGHQVGYYGLHAWFADKFSHVDFGEDFSTDNYKDFYTKTQIPINFKDPPCPVCKK